MRVHLSKMTLTRLSKKVLGLRGILNKIVKPR